MKHLRRKRQRERVKEVFVHRLTLLESVSSPGSSHKADVDSLLAAAPIERCAEAALYACQGAAAPDQCKEPNGGQVQQTACGY